MMHILSLGAGVQSSTMALMASAGEITPMPTCAIFADTGDEPLRVYDWLAWLEPRLAFPLHRVKRKGPSLADASVLPRVSRKNGFTYFKHWAPTYTVNPDGSKGMLPRKCTYDFKILPITQAVRRIAAIPRGCKEPRVTQWVGISRDEAHRMKPARELWVFNWYPLVERGITRRDCLRWMRDHHHPSPPKSACVFCPYHSDGYWRDLKTTQPEEFARAVAFERSMNAVAKKQNLRHGGEFLHASRLPLDQVIFDDRDAGQLELGFGNECEGMCGV